MKKIIYLLTTLIIFCGITSCNNFMNGSDLIQEINDILAEANAPEVEVMILAEGEYGSTSPSGKSYYKINKPYTVLFTASSEYMFECWEALDRDTKEPLDNFVVFENKTLKETYFTVVQPYENILIQPKCSRIIKFNAEPTFDMIGVSCDTPIVITFNTPMNRDDLQSFDNVSILSSNLKYRDIYNTYYQEPVLSSDGKVLTIAPKGNIISDLFNNDEIVNICVVLKNTIRTESGIMLSRDYNEEEIEVLNTRINKQREKNRPEINSIIIKDKNNTVLSTNKVSLWDSNVYYQNHIQNTVKFSVSGKDDESGVKSVLISEVLIRKPNGEVINIDAGTSQFNDFVNKGQNEYTCEFEYQLKSKSDGLVELKIELIDYAGVHSYISQPMYVIKDTSTDMESINIWNTASNYRKMCWNIGNETFFVDDDGNTYTAQRHIIKVCYGFGETTLQELTLTENQNFVTLPEINTNSEYLFRIYMEDSLGNGINGEVYRTVKIPKQTRKINFFAYTNNKFIINMPVLNCLDDDLTVEYAFKIDNYYYNATKTSETGFYFPLWDVSVPNLDDGVHNAQAITIYKYNNSDECKIYGPSGEDTKICKYNGTNNPSNLSSNKPIENSVSVTISSEDINNSTKTVSCILKENRSMAQNSYFGYSSNNRSWIRFMTQNESFHYDYNSSAGEFMYYEYDSSTQKMNYTTLITTTTALASAPSTCSTPPYVGLGNLYSTRNSIAIKPFHASNTEDNTQGFNYLIDENDNKTYVPIKYWIIPYEEKWNNSNNPISVNDLYKYPYEMYYCKDPGYEYTTIPTGSIPDGKYIVYASISNCELNTFTGPVQYINMGTDSTTKVFFSTYNNKLKISISNKDNSKKYYVNLFECYDDYADADSGSYHVHNKRDGYNKYLHIWDVKNRPSNTSYILDMISHLIDETGSIEIDLNPDTFYKFCVMSHASSDSIGDVKKLHNYTDVNYVYNGDYSYASIMTEKNPGKEYKIISDVYAYTSTFYSPERLDNSVEIWQNKGNEVNIKVLSKTKNQNYPDYIYNVEKQYIPSGYYYRVITVFADGSTKMSDIYRN